MHPRSVPTQSVHLLLAAGLLAALSGCQVLAKLTPGSREAEHPVDFAELLAHARRASLVYETPEAIQAANPGAAVTVCDVPGAEVRFFVLRDDAAQVQHVAIRGTANLVNVRTDAAFTPHPVEEFGIHMHQGFALAAVPMVSEVLPLLQKDYTTTITGHSLGGALAVVLGLHLERAGYRVERVVTFGQPKVTNPSGARAMAQLPLVRVSNPKDPVIAVPPALALLDSPWSYTHAGPEVVLWDRDHYVYLEEHQALFVGITSFYANLGSFVVAEHAMQRYLDNLEVFAKQARELSLEKALSR